MNELISVKIEKVNGTLVTTSNRVAEELEVRHDHLLNKIDTYISKFSSPETSGQFYIPSEYKTLDGRAIRNYLITEKGIAQLIGGYSAAVSKAFDLNVAYINEFEKMRNILTGGKVPSNFKEALKLALEQEEKLELLRLDNKIKEQQIAELKPKADYHDLILQCPELLSVTEISKDYGMGAKTLNKLLHKLGVQYNQSGIWFLYSKYQDKGYTQTKTYVYNKLDGTQGTSVQTYWTQKGRLFLYDLLKRNEILPMIEQEVA